MKVAWLIGVLIALYLLLWPVPIAPVSWQSPANNGFEGEFAENTRLSDLTLIDLGDDYGPEDFALNHEGTLATSSHWCYLDNVPRSRESMKRQVKYLMSGCLPLRHAAGLMH